MRETTFQYEPISSSKWDSKHSPKHVLVVRFHALGDLFITFPAIAALKKKWPHAQFHLMTRRQYAPLAQSLDLFDAILALSHTVGRRTYLNLLKNVPRMWYQGYDIVVDLQRNQHSRILRHLLRPSAWTEFDRYSPQSAMTRTLSTLKLLGLDDLEPDYTFSHAFEEPDSVQVLLRKHGRREGSPLVILNPAGAFSTRNWPIKHYVAWSRLWLQQFPDTQFLVMGLPTIKDRAEALAEKLGSSLINLVGHTSLVEAYALVLKANLMLTEDSGLAHLSWASGKPTLSILGGTRSDWVAPQGPRSAFFDSSHLECGNCMRTTCMHSTVQCLEFLYPEEVLKRAVDLIDRSQATELT